MKKNIRRSGIMLNYKEFSQMILTQQEEYELSLPRDYLDATPAKVYEKYHFKNWSIKSIANYYNTNESYIKQQLQKFK